MRPIDADTLMPSFIKKANTMKDRHGVKLGEEWLLNYNDIKDVIDNAPTVDTTCPNCDSGYAQGYSDGYLKGKEERPQGEWINEHSIDIGYKTAECSCCGERSRLISHDTGFGHKYEYYPFCHWCGAYMRGGRE